MSDVLAYLLLALIVWGVLVHPVLHVRYRLWRLQRYQRRRQAPPLVQTMCEAKRRAWK